MKNGDQPAFTRLHRAESFAEFHSLGLTKREYFAALAMHGLCANPAYLDYGFERIAKESAIAADELLKQLETK